MLKYCLHRCKTQEICNKAVDAYLPTLEFVLDWFVTSKIIKKRDHDLFTNNDIIFINEDSSYVTCLSDELDIISVDFTNINALMMLILVKMILKLLKLEKRLAKRSRTNFYWLKLI